jgi:hypothetical protein
MEPEVSAEIAVLGCKEGWFTGKKLSDYIRLDTSDFRNARRIVNGMDKADLIAGHARDYDSMLLREGYGVTKEEPTNFNPNLSNIWIELLKGLFKWKV